MQQATCAHSGADTGTSSGNVEITTAPSRRALLGFAGISALALAAPIAAAAAPVARISSAMRAALDAYVAAAARSDTYDTTIYEPKWKAWRERVEAVPHTVVDINAMPGIIATWTTASESDVAYCQRLVKHHPTDDQISGRARKFLAAVDARKTALADLSIETGVDTACARSDELGEEKYQAACAVVKLPASSLTDLAAKIQQIEEYGFETDGWVWEAIVADVRRLAVHG